jgi:hypothetical protein
MQTNLIRLLAALAAVVAAPVAQAGYTPDPAVAKPEVQFAGRDIAAETALYCMTLGIYFEGGSTFETEVGQRHIARVIAERAKANRRMWGGPTICGVVFHKAKGVCQFSFACLPKARRTARGGKLWQISAAIAREELEGRNGDPHPLIRYYMQAELTPLRNVCRFRREFVPVVKAGRHEFFREPSSAERKTLARGQFRECTRYAELSKSKKRKGKKAYAKTSKGKKHYAKLKAKKKLAGVKVKLARLKR